MRAALAQGGFTKTGNLLQSVETNGRIVFRDDNGVIVATATPESILQTGEGRSGYRLYSVEPNGGDIQLSRAAVDEAQASKVVEKWWRGDSITGERLLHNLGKGEAASEALRDAGIPGLKYFDQMSRPLGDTLGQTLVVRGKEIGSDDLTGSFAANRLLESNMDFEAAKRTARGMGQDDVVRILDDWAKTPDKVNIKDKRTRNYVTWDQDVLDRVKILEQP